MPGPPKSTTVCGTSSDDVDAAAEPLRRGVLDRRQIRLCRQRAEHAIEHRLQGLGVDVADDGDLQVFPRQHPMRIGLEIVDGDGRHQFQRAVDRPAIGMALERGLPPALAGDIARARRLPPQDRQDLRAIDLDIRRIETRRGQRQPQQIESLVAIFRQRAQRAADIVALGAEAHLDGFALEPIVRTPWNRDRPRLRRAARRQSWRCPPCRAGPERRRRRKRSRRRSAAPPARAPATPRCRRG